ncbi:MAG: hypothetical protein ACLTQI_06880 [Slackia sp.]
MPDSLDGIYRSIDNFAQVSKFGGGMGMPRQCATGAAIRGFEGAWRRHSVDSYHQRHGGRVISSACAGAAAVYLDAWHKDLPEFLQLHQRRHA